MKVEYLIVGAGFTGAVVAERIASQTDSTVLVIDRRSHVAGNAYDTRDQNGLMYHVYGPHIFHTNSLSVWEYLSRFTDWRSYQHRVLGVIDGRQVPIPFNLTSIEILFERAEASILRDILVSTYGYGSKIAINKLRESGDLRVHALAEYIYSKVFLGYSRKQWGVQPETLSPSVLARVPVHISYDDRYFQDKYQGLPSNSYTRLVENILDHRSISVELGVEFSNFNRKNNFETIIYTGEIDEYFGYCYGALPYRSLHFEMQLYQQSQHQTVAQVNYPNDHEFTRITEMSHLTDEWSKCSLVSIEYPRDHVPGKTTPYYPIPSEPNQRLHRKYVELAAREAPKVVFAGRLGEYRYYNMDQAVAAAMVTADRIVRSHPICPSPILP
ncbi:UDP-galactopyranose mutase [Consotaella aegiceratis]|uniref:UDP-galactopyranose mutase n=1 Tax=Consotaella aegiceratis TaxID=3097961 RepID=UPI002F4301C8